MKASDVSGKKTVLIMIGVMLSVFLSALDNTIAGTAMPRIISDLKGIELYAWPFTIYMLCSTISIPIFGRMADLYGHKLTYFSGIAIFLAGSVLCGFSSNMPQLIVFRGIQGVGGGTLIANSFIIVGSLFPPAERAKYMGFVAAVIGLASIIGPMLGGVITDGLSWHWVFFINIPVGLGALSFILFALPGGEARSVKRKIDLPGAVTFVIALVPALLAFTWAGRIYAWSSPHIVGMFAFSAVMFIIFGLIERKTVEPLIPLSLFKNPIFNLCIVDVFFVSCLMFGAVMLVPLFVQNVLGANATTSGAMIMPMTVSLVIGGAITGVLIAKTGRYKIFGLAAMLIIVAGAFMLQQIDEQSSSSRIILTLTILGAGIGITMPVFDLASQNAFPQSQLGLVTSMIQFSRNIGGTIGSAILGSIMLSHMNAGIARLSETNLSPVMKGLVENSQFAVETQLLNRAGVGLSDVHQLLGQLKTIQANSIHQAFLVSFWVGVVGLAAILFLKEIPLRKTNEKMEVHSRS
ncbi:EmrB/QacA subfamily drug resistance transporter [Hydrogenispora ethanolica]|uniref:EmrB/QacA subfamily drug resistance transporter n=1 Tax=Hydrogenispora ethanolica TaxID=1082276 RepID=A0A4R1RE09_HYDET|nr:MDR family MFS transporter [Hydrogenispora ethanolica]TCL63792.1 EmrB/QacA subfamily drug resistance transporter [Hydrogenispora ethanolica]